MYLVRLRNLSAELGQRCWNTGAEYCDQGGACGLASGKCPYASCRELLAQLT